MSEFRELWKHPTNPRALKVSRVFIMLKLDTTRKKKKKKVLKVKVTRNSKFKTFVPHGVIHTIGTQSGCHTTSQIRNLKREENKYITKVCQ